MSSDKGPAIIPALLQQLRDRRIVMPAPARIERIAAAGRARARRLAADAMIAGVDAAKIARVEGLLVNDPSLKRTPIAWLRDFAESPSASNLMAQTRGPAPPRRIRRSPSRRAAGRTRRIRALRGVGAPRLSFGRVREARAGLSRISNRWTPPAFWMKILLHRGN
jgi:hypothetical protein